MNRFLFSGLIDDHIALTAERRTWVQMSVVERVGRERGANLVRMAPGMLALLAIPLWQFLGRTYGVAVNAVAQIAFVAVILLWIWLLFRRAMQRHARQAIRELGFADICVRCGYDLSGRMDHPGRCPECGHANQPFTPEQVSDGSTAPAPEHPDE